MDQTEQQYAALVRAAAYHAIRAVREDPKPWDVHVLIEYVGVLHYLPPIIAHRGVERAIHYGELVLTGTGPDDAKISLG